MNQPKNLTAVLLPLLILPFFSCNKSNNGFEIKGDIKGLNTDWVYLYHVYPVVEKPKPIDSARVTNNTFCFKFLADTVYEPHLAYIAYKDKEQNKLKELLFQDIHNSKNRYMDFLLEPGQINITGNLKTSETVNISDGPQNAFLAKNQHLPFISISHDPQKHKVQFNRFLNKIKETPDAYWAIFALGNLKFDFNKNELTEIFNAFDAQTQQSYSARQIKQFIDSKPDNDKKKSNVSLINLDGKRVNMIDTTKKLNMIIFWASWCGPCRREVPSLKKLAQEMANQQQLRMVSVSIDKNMEAWKQAVNEEKMPWQQLAVDASTRIKIEAQFDLNAVPQIFFMDNKNELVAHIMGWEEGNDLKYKKIISDHFEN